MIIDKKKNQTFTIHGMSDCAGYNIVILFLLIKVWIFLKARNPETGICLDTMARSIGSELGVSPCHGMGGNQVCNVHKRTQTALPTT